MTDLERVLVDVAWRGQPKRQISAGTPYPALIKSLIREINPAAQFDFDDTTLVTPLLLIDPEEDRWQFACECAQAIGMSLGVDGDLYWLRKIHYLPLWRDRGSPNRKEIG